MKLFEIPIYALNRETLMKRYSDRKNKLLDRAVRAQTTEEDQERIIEINTWPQRLWDYNHIVGYIVISIGINDVSFELYVPADTIERYHWDNKSKKMLLKNNQINGCHFNYRNMKTDKEIRNRIHQMLDDITQRMIDKRFYVDREAFDQAEKLIDYSKLLKN